MSLLPIKKYGDKILMSKTELIKIEDVASLSEIINNMFETCEDADGRGLSANQIGLDYRMFVVLHNSTKKLHKFVVINPEYILRRGKLCQLEGCLSIPEFFLRTDRFDYVKIKGLNEKGEEIQIEANGTLARILQHEIDHLDGRTIVERAPLYKQEYFRKELIDRFEIK